MAGDKMSHSNKNIKLEGVTEDSGWKVIYESNCVTEWMRQIKTDRSAESIIKELVDAGDYAGWTGVELHKGFSRNGLLVFVSTWDSSG
jgi:hypothetical protein